MNDPIVSLERWPRQQSHGFSGLNFSERNPVGFGYAIVSSWRVVILIGQLSDDAIVLAGALFDTFDLVYKVLCSNIATLYRSNHSTRTGCHRIIFPLFTYLRGSFS